MQAAADAHAHHCVSVRTEKPPNLVDRRSIGSARTADKDLSTDDEHVAPVGRRWRFDVLKPAITSERLGRRYSSDAHQSFARCRVGNSSTTNRLGSHEPSSFSARPPRARYLPS